MKKLYESYPYSESEIEMIEGAILILRTGLHFVEITVVEVIEFSLEYCLSLFESLNFLIELKLMIREGTV